MMNWERENVQHSICRQLCLMGKLYLGVFVYGYLKCIKKKEVAAEFQ